jgi:GTP-binding protein
MNGITDLDMQVARLLRQNKKPLILISNKVDNNELQYSAAEFYKLGLGDPYCVSAINGSGTGDLLDDIVSKLT